MSTAPVTYEHLAVPGRRPDEAVELQRRLGDAEDAARLFGSGLLGVDLELSWALGRARPVQWIRAADGSLSVHIWLDLLSERDRPPGTTAISMTAEDYMSSFRTGFLHALGRVLYSPNAWLEQRSAAPRARHPKEGPAREADAGGGVRPLEWALHRSHPRRRTLPRRARVLLEEPVTRAALEGLFEELEDARVDGALADSFAGAARELESRRRYLEARSANEDPVVALAARVACRLAAPPDTSAGGRRSPQLPGSLDSGVAVVRSLPDADGARRLAEFLVFDLYPVLIAEEAGLAALAEAVARRGEEAPEMASSTTSRRGLREYLSRDATMDAVPRSGAPGTVVVALPHVGGGEMLFRIDRAFAHRLEPDDTTRQVLDRLARVFGPRAEEAFAAEAAPLRRALRVNWERRRTGRYRTGRHVGIPNLRRYVLLDDLRLFQRLEVPDAFSYYFHLLVDVSYSMLEHHNAAKALAVAYGFTDLLRSFKVPVDVTLYSAGVTELFDHQRDRLERFFGADFGYLLSGTLEMEAVAYAKEKADSLTERHKIFVVVTDGTPFTGSLEAVGAVDLHDYYRETFIPWLRDAGIELLAIGVECDPAYHDRSVCLTESWDAVEVLVDLIERTVDESESRSRQLWV